MDAESQERRFCEVTSEIARRFLVDWRGYEVVIPDKHQSDQAVCLFTWALTSENDAAPPEEIRRTIADLRDRYDADGIILIQGHLKVLSDTGFLIILGTAGLAWPVVLPADSGAGLRVDLFEARSTRIVWRSQAEDWIGDPNDRNFSLRIERLFHPLEHAVPRVLIEDHSTSR